MLGDFALEFAAQDRIKERKYENALYKALAIIGIILEWHQVGGKKRKVESPKIILHLAMLLPWNEYNDNERFAKQLELMLTRFKFRGVAWDIALETFLCRPEGAGLLATRIKQVRFVQPKPEREDGWHWLSNPIMGRVRTFILNQRQLTIHVGEQI